jgi:Trypsin-like peptidase domain
MFTFRSLWAGSAGIILLLTNAPLYADKLTKAEIGKLGKAATAYVEVEEGSGTAFCIHPSGLFVTNEHVVRGLEKAKIKVVIDGSLKTERVLLATVARVDRNLDLALLRVSTKEELPSVALGTTEGISELMDVVAFGFPLGSALSPDGKEHPAISVNSGNVSALRRKGGELQFLQVDVSVTFGSSGGPVLDENGKVVGVIVAGVPGERGINLAIPVNALQRFLNAPEILLTPTELTAAMLNKPLEFKAKVVSFIPGAKEPTLRLVLQTDEVKPRELPMSKRDGMFVATATPVEMTDDGRVEVSIRMQSGMIVGRADNANFKVGDRSVKFSDARRIEFKPKSRALLADGTIVEGAIAGLDTVEVSLGQQAIKVELRDAGQISVTQPVPVGLVRATVIATVDDKEVGRIEAPIWSRDNALLVPPWQAAAVRDLNKAKFAYAKQIVPLVTRMRGAFDGAITAAQLKRGDQGTRELQRLLYEKKAFETTFQIPSSEPMRAAVAEYKRDLKTATATMAAAYDSVISAANANGNDELAAEGVEEKNSLNSVLDEKRRGAPFGIGLKSAINSRQQLREFLKDSEWEWGPGTYFKVNGYAENPDWGAKTRWEAIDRRTAILIIESGRDVDRYAVLCFSEDCMYFNLLDFVAMGGIEGSVFRKR